AFLNLAGPKVEPGSTARQVDVSGFIAWFLRFFFREDVGRLPIEHGAEGAKRRIRGFESDVVFLACNQIDGHRIGLVVFVVLLKLFAVEVYVLRSPGLHDEAVSPGLRCDQLSDPANGKFRAGDEVLPTRIPIQIDAGLDAFVADSLKMIVTEVFHFKARTPIL